MWEKLMNHRSSSGSQCLHIITCLILEHGTLYFLLNTFLVPKVLGYFTDLMIFINITGIGNEKFQGQLRATHFCK